MKKMRVFLLLSAYFSGILRKDIDAFGTPNHATKSSNIHIVQYLKQLPSNVIFSNDTGNSQLVCNVYGSSQAHITWISEDGSVVTNVQGLRQILPNGTLYFPPFASHLFRTDVHDTTYRCRISYLHYKLLSRNVKVRAVLRETYDVYVEKVDVILGNTAFLRCHITPYVHEFAKVSAWYRDKELFIPEQSEYGTRFTVATPSGDLYIRSVTVEDKQKPFSCVMTDTLTGKSRMSPSVILTIKEFLSDLAPITTQKPLTEITVDKGNDVHLPCNVQGNPPPKFNWFRLSSSGSIYAVPSSKRIFSSQSLLFIRESDERDTGRWICKAVNQFGEQELHIHLTINSELVVQIQPQIQIVNTGTPAKFNCMIVGSKIGKIEWIHNGLVVDDNDAKSGRITFITPTILSINNANKNDRGVYQCIVSNTIGSEQASAELEIGETPPEIIYSFAEQNVRPVAFVSLKCTASGSPQPQFSWMLDYQPILSSIHQYTFDQFMTNDGYITTHLNITHVNADDGGLYTCIASNTIGAARHKARLNVYGPPYIRAIGSIKAITGEAKEIYCPYSGYPIQSIRWIRNGHNITSNAKYTVGDVSSGGMLKIHRVDGVQDEGAYTCIATNPSGDEARREMQLVIHSPPAIEPFSFPKNINVGGRAQLTCAVSSGDMPIHFSWKKDGSNIPLSLQISEKKEEFFTLLVLKDISAKHSGKYTCFAVNSAAQANYSAELLVQVPPFWKLEPTDLSVIFGNAIAMACEADGFPEPKIRWLRGQRKTPNEFHPIPSKNNTLSVNYATSSDAGYYMCEAFNGVGSNLTKVVYIHVNVAVHFDSPMKNMSTKRGNDITMECMALGDDPIDVFWMHKNSRIDLNNYSIVELKTETGVRSQLTIRHTERFDSGKYTCSAENLYGTSEFSIYLAVQERPDPPTDLEVIEVKSRRVKLSWKRPYDGMSPELSYLVQYQPLNMKKEYADFKLETSWESSSIMNLTLLNVNGMKYIEGVTKDEAFVNNLHPATQYLIRMQAINEIESSAFTDSIMAMTKEEAPTEPPAKLEVKTGGQGELIVTWDIPAKHSWNGDLLGYTISCVEEKQNIININTNDTAILSFTFVGWATSKILIPNLKKFTKYAVKIRTYNTIAASPWSAITYATTLEDVPEAPPQNVSCKSLSSQSIKVEWQEPPSDRHNGMLQGYKILFRPLTKNNEFILPYEVKRTSNMETYLHALLKATNYSIQVLSFTLSGDGAESFPIYCTTEEDVPNPPARIKALTLTADSILLAWLQPDHANGIITHYTIFSKEHGRMSQAKSYKVRIDNNKPLLYEIRGLMENVKYDFWMTASTSKGDGDPTNIVSQFTSTRAPAKIASFSNTIKVSVGASISLECFAVGNPTPRTRWIRNDQPVTFSPYYSVSQGYLRIHRIESILSGNYSCSAKNLFGEDDILYTLIAIQAPNISLFSVQYASHDSIRVIWETSNDGGAPLQGYYLFYRPAVGTWSSVSIPYDQNTYTLYGLKCGTKYILKMNAHNKVGNGDSTDELVLWTKGKAPQIPEHRDFISTNSSCLNLHLNAWHNGGCPISHFSIDYRRLHTPFWTTVASNIYTMFNENMSFCEFVQATWYELKIQSRNDAGETTALYKFATTTISGEEISQPNYIPIETENEFELVEAGEDSQFVHFGVVVVALAAMVLFLIIFVRYKKVCCFEDCFAQNSEDILKSHNSKVDRVCEENQQVYSASPLKFVDKDDSSEMYEISPYATFNDCAKRTNKPPIRSRTSSSLDFALLDIWKTT
ncbi:cell adhesion molecule Dscam2 isoform X2 [Toxorhynchites rutilus septentrionalis]|uniref:cell adhesion molecule Dscam2 isoform X2 n=1 Tax=Toxorhynchites rutilus septentrionalis TaxID=329112 RepID=UPI002478DAA2|nr:cell adhesion molecule Dscam2 isoform X2 [Toxorhynchites rutilus septentrionalis]